MPIYKISRRATAEKRARVAFVRVRFVSLLLTGLLGAGTVWLLLYGTRH